MRLFKRGQKPQVHEEYNQMNIFVLEDDVKQQFRIESVVRDVIDKHELDCHKLVIHSQTEQLIAEIEEAGSHQIFFLDIEIKDETQKGFDVAEQIRDRDPYSAIVFVTTHSEFMPLAFEYKIGAVDYVDKALSEAEFAARIEEDILTVYKRLGVNPVVDVFSYTNEYTTIQVPFHDIQYIETSERSHRVALYTASERMEFTGSLSDIVKANPRLVHCHRSYLVNPQHVVKIDKSKRELTLACGATCFISRTKMKQTLQAVTGLNKGVS